MHVSYIVPIVGMQCGDAVTGNSVSLGYILEDLECIISSLCPAGPERAPVLPVPPVASCYSESHNNQETRLGALCHDSCRQLAAEALRLGLTPTINQMRCV